MTMDNVQIHNILTQDLFSVYLATLSEDKVSTAQNDKMIGE
jgi:hypothetical protein